MSDDPPFPGAASQTFADSERSGTVPLRQHLQSLISAVIQRFEQEVGQLGRRMDESRKEDYGRTNQRIDHYIENEREAARLRGVANDARLTEVDHRFVEARIVVETAMASSEKAVLKAEAANERRFESVNEFRGQLNDMITRLLPRGEADARIASLAEKIDVVSTRLTAIEARTAGVTAATVEARATKDSGNSQAGMVIGAIGVAFGILAGFGGMAMNIANNSSRIQETTRAVIERQAP